MSDNKENEQACCWDAADDESNTEMCCCFVEMDDGTYEDPCAEDLDGCCCC